MADRAVEPSAGDATTLYAIGHSTRPFEKFVEILQAHGIQLLVDIRTVPRSRHNPQFNREFLEKELPQLGINYRHFKELGGLRHPAKDSGNLGWENKSFRGYADYMQTLEFGRALDALVKLGTTIRLAFMCAEGNPFRCHRLLLADALTVRGVRVLHIASRRSARIHQLTSFAVVRGTSITYPHKEQP